MEARLQEAWVGYGETAKRIILPASDREVVPGVPWGSPAYFNTPAYWAMRCQWDDHNPDYVTRMDLLREVVFCLLGGFGIKFEVNAAAFDRLEERGFFNDPLCYQEEVVRSWLLEPLTVDGRIIRYRFPNQRAARIAECRKHVKEIDIEAVSPKELREALLGIDGIGPKTASWIVRNCSGSDEVAIIDVHLIRACQHMRLFPAELSLPRDYAALEEQFLHFSRAIDVRPSVLDAVMWSEVRRARHLLEAR